MRQYLFIKRRIGRIEIFLIHLLNSAAKPLTEALIMDYFPLPQELYDVVYVWIVAEPQDVVIGRARLLLCRHVLGKVGDHVALHGHGCGVPRKARSRRWVYARRVVYEIRVESSLLDLVDAHRARQLVHDGAYHLEVAELFRAQRSIGNVPMYQIRGQARGLRLKDT